MTNFKAQFQGIIAGPSLWRALGADDAYAYANGHGPVRFRGYLRSDTTIQEGYALELLTRARAELPDADPERDGDSIVARAVQLRGSDRSALALAELGRGLSALAHSGIRVGGAVTAQIEHVVRQLGAAS